MNWSKYGVVLVDLEAHHQRRQLSGGSSVITPAIERAGEGVSKAGSLRLQYLQTPSERYAERYAPTIGIVIRHICAALRDTASGLKETYIDESVTINMSAAGRAIAHFHHQREERRQAPAAYVEYVFGKRSDPAKLERSLGVKIADYCRFTEEQQRDHWEVYWALRDSTLR